MCRSLFELSPRKEISKQEGKRTSAIIRAGNHKFLENPDNLMKIVKQLMRRVCDAIARHK